MALVFVTGFYKASGRAPNSWTLSSEAMFDTYYTCMIVSFASIRRSDPDALIWLFTNETVPTPFSDHLASLGVEVKSCDTNYQTNTSVIQSHPGCLYLMDVLNFISQNGVPQSAGGVVFIDPDTVVRQSLAPLEEELQNFPVVAYDIGMEPATEWNGQTRASLTSALEAMANPSAHQYVTAYGGEFVAMRTDMLTKMAAYVDEFWQWYIGDGMRLIGPRLTDEHLITVGIASMSETATDASPWIKRIWTADVYSNVDGSEPGIPIWHLPSEKRRGFQRLFDSWVASQGFNELSDLAFISLVDKEIRLPPTSGQPAWRRMYGRTRSQIKGLVSKFL